MNVLTRLQSKFHDALAPLTDEPSRFASLVRPAQSAGFGDYQANCAMPLAGKLKRPPREIAADLIDRLDAADWVEPPEVAGPGFINLRLRDDRLRELLETMFHSQGLDILRAEPSRTYVIDYSSPNVAKPMHVGHLRSTVIGDCLCRLLRLLGHQVISDNHIGDWGTQFGMILLGYKRFRDESAFAEDPVAELERLYRKVNEVAKQDPEIAKAAREETVKLHAGDVENRQLWESFLPVCLKEINRIYGRLGVEFDHALGESFYGPMLRGIVEDLEAAGIAVVSEGALCIFLNEDSAPAIIRKSDGAYTYATTDLATIKYRVEHFQPDTIVYVVDQRQANHFRQLFTTVQRWGFHDVELVHVSFGTILGSDGRPFRTREGGIVGLEDLLDEGVERARAIVDANSPELDETERARVAETVGIGATKYADLSQNRTSDYVFDWDKMLAMQGNTSTYLQYAYARIRSIFRKGNVDPSLLRSEPAPIHLHHPAERALGIELIRFAETLDAAAYEYRPNLLTNYLFELAERFSTFYNSCPVLKADDEAVRRSRLQLSDLTARVLAQGLDLLGIRVIEQM